MLYFINTLPLYIFSDVIFLSFIWSSYFYSAVSFQCSHWKAKAVALLLQQKPLSIYVRCRIFFRHVSSYTLDPNELKLFCKSSDHFALSSVLSVSVQIVFTVRQIAQKSFHGIRLIEWYRLEGIFKDHLIQPPCCG